MEKHSDKSNQHITPNEAIRIIGRGENKLIRFESKLNDGDYAGALKLRKELPEEYAHSAVVRAYGAKVYERHYLDAAKIAEKFGLGPEAVHYAAIALLRNNLILSPYGFNEKLVSVSLQLFFGAEPEYTSTKKIIKRFGLTKEDVRSANADVIKNGLLQGKFELTERMEKDAIKKDFITNEDVHSSAKEAYKEALKRWLIPIATEIKERYLTTEKAHSLEIELYEEYLIKELAIAAAAIKDVCKITDEEALSARQKVWAFWVRN